MDKKRPITATKKAGHVEPPPSSVVINTEAQPLPTKSEETDGGYDQDSHEFYKALPDDKLEGMIRRLELNLELLCSCLPDKGNRLRDRIQLLEEEKKRRMRVKTIADECDQNRNLRITATESTLITLCDQSEEKGDNLVLLKVQPCRVVENGNEADGCYYLIGRTTPLHQLMINYTQRIGVSFNSVRFLFDGKDIIPACSAHHLKLKDHDRIEVIPRNGYTVAAGSELTLICLPRAVGERSIHIQVHCENGKNLNYLIGRNSPLENLLFDYADRILKPRDYITLVFDQRPIDIKKTADDLQLVDGDIVTTKVMMPYETSCEFMKIMMQSNK